MNNFTAILNQLKIDNPSINFVKGDDFVWSSASQTITYKSPTTNEHLWALIHETAHAQLNHKTYNSDQHLLAMELEAWQHAKKISSKLNVAIDQNHIEDCLDTYRDWVHNRSSCPDCGVVSGQGSNQNYKCFNCQCSWSVPNSPLCKISKKRIVSNTAHVV